MHKDDTPVGRLLTRREVLSLLGVSGSAMLVGYPRTLGATQERLNEYPSCVARPQQIEGPYFVDERLHRGDIRSDPDSGDIKEGVPLRLAFNVSRIDNGTCMPLQGAHLDVWQCDAFGVYSNVEDRNFSTIGQRFLRGYQMTDSEGLASFTTIYPGWYPGRAVHIHFKIRTEPDAASGHEFTSQLYFQEHITDAVCQHEPYAERGLPNVRNSQDRIFRSGGDQLMLALEGDPESGFRSTFSIGLQY